MSVYIVLYTISVLLAIVMMYYRSRAYECEKAYKVEVIVSNSLSTLLVEANKKLLEYEKNSKETPIV